MKENGAAQLANVHAAESERGAGVVGARVWCGKGWKEAPGNEESQFEKHPIPLK